MRINNKEYPNVSLSVVSNRKEDLPLRSHDQMRQKKSKNAFRAFRRASKLDRAGGGAEDDHVKV